MIRRFSQMNAEGLGKQVGVGIPRPGDRGVRWDLATDSRTAQRAVPTLAESWQQMVGIPRPRDWGVRSQLPGPQPDAPSVRPYLADCVWLLVLWLLVPIFAPPASAQGVSGFASPAAYVATNAPVATAPTVPLPASMDALDDKHRLAVGDRVSFRIIEDEDEPRSLVITDSGDLDVPYIGRYAAKGKSCRELAKELKAELEKDYYYTATVILAVDLMARSRGLIYLVGPVRMPGQQNIPSDEVFTVSKAILRAGGFTDAADKRKVRITRKGAEGGTDTTMVVDVGEIIEKGRTQNDVVLESGDLIWVPDRLIRF